MTENEAKTKRCCGPEGCGKKIIHPSSIDRYCIGSACMGWGWLWDSKTGEFSRENGKCGLA